MRARAGREAPSHGRRRGLLHRLRRGRWCRDPPTPPANPCAPEAELRAKTWERHGWLRMKGRTASPAHRIDRRLLRPAAAHRAGVAARARGRVLLIAAPAARAAPLRARAGPAPHRAGPARWVLLVAPAAGRAEAALGVAPALGAAPCATPTLAVAARQIVPARARTTQCLERRDDMYTVRCHLLALRVQKNRIPGWCQMSSATSQQPPRGRCGKATYDGGV